MSERSPLAHRSGVARQNWRACIFLEKKHRMAGCGDRPLVGQSCSLALHRRRAKCCESSSQKVNTYSKNHRNTEAKMKRVSRTRNSRGKNEKSLPDPKLQQNWRACIFLEKKHRMAGCGDRPLVGQSCSLALHRRRAKCCESSSQKVNTCLRKPQKR